MSASSLVKLSASAVIQDGCIVEGCDLTTLPRTVLQELLLTSISQSRMLCLKSLITNWPMKHLVLQHASGFDEPKAVLLAYCLQRTKHNLQLVDIRGCDIGIQGTKAFCKLAGDIPVSENDVSGMKILDTRPLEDSIKENFTTDFPRQGFPPLVVMLDCVVDEDNCGLAIQACINHSVLDLKMSHVTICPIGRRKVQCLLSSLEPAIVTGLNLSMNGLQEEGIDAISPIILTFTNLTDLNLSYNGITRNSSTAIQHIANICKKLTKLRKLDLTGNYIRSGVCTILQCLQSPLTHLALGGCGARDCDLREMCALDTLHHLQSLKLDGSGFVNCIELLCNFVLKSAGTLKFLSIEDNMFNSSNVACLCQMIRQLPLLKTLSLCYNHLLPDDIRAFQKEFPALDVINRDWLY
ncbi:hypothetical protein ACROYT_G037965 [Oculina patagonica]